MVMAHLETAAYEAVQAALLNSECHPRAAVQAALRAIAEFADKEDILQSDHLKLLEQLRDAQSHGESAQRIAALQAEVDKADGLDDLLEMTKAAWEVRARE